MKLLISPFKLPSVVPEKYICLSESISKSRVESVDEIRNRLSEALEHIDSNRLIAAPDCGLGILGKELAIRKLKNLSEAAHSIKT